MKTATLIVLTAALSFSAATAQQQESSDRNDGHIVPVTGIQTVERDGSLSNGYGSAGEETTLDTLTDVYDRSSGIAVYTYMEDEIEYPISGTNSYFHGLGTRFPLEGSATVLGLLVGIANVHINGDPDTYYILTTEFSGNGQEFYNYMTSDMMDTSRMWTYIPYTTPASVSGMFGVFIETVAMTSPSSDPDAYALTTNMQGDGVGEGRTLYFSVVQGQAQGSYLSQLFQIDDAPLDVDLMVLPVLELSTSGVDSPVRLKGISVAGLHPNPAADQAMLRFTLDRPGRVAWSLTDMTGRRVTDRREAEFTAGEHTVQMAVDGLTAGTYLYVIETEETRFAGQFQVIR